MFSNLLRIQHTIGSKARCDEEDAFCVYTTRTEERNTGIDT